MKKVKILENTSTPELEKLINKYLKKGWEIRGNVFSGVDCLTVILYKK